MIAFFPFIQPCSWNWDGNYAFTFPQLSCPCRHYGRWWNVPPPVCDNTTPVIMLLFECHPGRLDNVLIIFIAYQAVRKPGNIRYKSEPTPPPPPPPHLPHRDWSKTKIYGMLCLNRNFIVLKSPGEVTYFLKDVLRKMHFVSQFGFR